MCVNAPKRPDLRIPAAFLLACGDRNGNVVVVPTISFDRSTQITSDFFLSMRFFIRNIFYINGCWIKLVHESPASTIATLLMRR